MDPNVIGHRNRFPKYLRIGKSNIERIANECLGDITEIDLLSSDDSAGEEHDDDAGKKSISLLKQKRLIVKDPDIKTLVGDRIFIGAKIFYHWLVWNRPLLRGSLITAKTQSYNSLNILISHVVNFQEQFDE